MVDKELSIVIPVFNEGKIIRRNIETIDAYLRTLGVEYEIIVVNDGSRDDTLEQASAISAKELCIISYTENKGKGFAVKRGMMAACGRFRLFMDMDLSTDLKEIPEFLKCVRDGHCDICVGNRNSIGLFDQKRPFLRALLGKIFAVLSAWASGCRLDDFTCGFKIFSARACAMVFPSQQIYNWSFDTELISIASQKGLSIHQVPVSWQHQEGSKVRLGPAVISSLVDLVKIWNNRDQNSKKEE